VLYPAEASFDDKDALASRLIDQVVQYYDVARVVSTKGEVGFVVLKYLVLFNIRRS
jgi:hypothetical protein